MARLHVDLRRPQLHECERLRVVSQRGGGTVVLIEAGREVEGQVGIAGIQGERSEIFLSGIGPAPVAGIHPSQRGMQSRAPLVVAGDHDFQAAFVRLG